MKSIHCILFAVVSLTIFVLTVSGILQTAIGFQDVTNEIAFSSISFGFGIVMIFSAYSLRKDKQPIPQFRADNTFPSYQDIEVQADRHESEKSLQRFLNETGQ
jgi:hypothetical protein